MKFAKKTRVYIAILGLLSLGLVSSSFGQDIHFSGQDYSPLNTNPALTGAGGSIEAFATYRNQYGAVAKPYQTIAASASFRIGESMKHGFFALGVNFYNDQAGSDKIVLNNTGLNFAYQLKLAEHSMLGLGIQTAFGHRALKTRNGFWGTQFNGEGFDPNLPSGEQIDRYSFSYFDAGAGLAYAFSSSNFNIDFGIGVFHLNRPYLSFVRDNYDLLYMRWTAHIKAEIAVGETTFLEPKIYFHLQGPSMEPLFGTDVRILIFEKAYFSRRTVFSNKKTGFSRGLAGNRQTSMAFGLYMRHNDALIARASFRYSGVDLGFSYDFNLFNELMQSSKSRGAFEIFLGYRFEQDFYSSKSSRRGRRR